MRDDFLDDDLFGNEAGEDENKDRLASYYLEKPENEIFLIQKELWLLYVLERVLANQHF